MVARTKLDGFGKGVGTVRGAVMAPAQNSWEANSQSAFVAFGWLNALKPDFKHQIGSHRSRWSESFHCVGSNPTIELENFTIVQAGIGLGKGHKLMLIRISCVAIP